MSEWIHMIVPMLVCADPVAEIEFCKTALGAQELSRRVEDGERVVHATLRIEECLVMIHCETDHLASRAPYPDGSSPVVIYLYLEGVDAVVERAVSAGAKIVTPLEDQFWGDRMARILDPAGHVWNVASRRDEADGSSAAAL